MFSKPRPRLTNCLATPLAHEQARVTVDSILWSGDFLITRSVKGSALKAAPRESGRILELEDTLLYSVAMSDFLALGDTGFGTREELTSPTRRNFTTNRPRLRCLSDEHGLVALGLAARAKRRCLNLCNYIRACGTDEEGPARRHATRHDQFVIWSNLFEQRWSIPGGRRGIPATPTCNFPPSHRPNRLETGPNCLIWPTSCWKQSASPPRNVACRSRNISTISDTMPSTRCPLRRYRSRSPGYFTRPNSNADRTSLSLPTSSANPALTATFRWRKASSAGVTTPITKVPKTSLSRSCRAFQKAGSLIGKAARSPVASSSNSAANLPAGISSPNSKKTSYVTKPSRKAGALRVPRPCANEPGTRLARLGKRCHAIPKPLSGPNGQAPDEQPLLSRALRPIESCKLSPFPPSRSLSKRKPSRVSKPAFSSTPTSAGR